MRIDRLSRASATLTFALVGLLSACAANQTVVPPIQHKVFRAQTLAGNKDKVGVVTADGRYRNAFIVGSKICSEPPPDLAANYDLEQSIEASLDAAVTYQALTLGLEGEGQSNASGVSEIADVAEKTEALLVVRESLFRLCELSINNPALTKDEVIQIFREILYTTRDLGRHDVLEQLVDAIEAAVGTEGVDVDMVHELTRLAAGIATIETFQSLLMSINAMPDSAARTLLATQLSLALVQQLRMFEARTPDPATGDRHGTECSEDECELSLTSRLTLVAAVSALVLSEGAKQDNAGWKLNNPSVELTSLGFAKGDIVESVANAPLAGQDAKALAKLIEDLVAAAPAEVSVVVKRGETRVTLTFHAK